MRFPPLPARLVAVAVVAAALVASVPVAAAQDTPSVSAGSSVRIENSTECPASNDVIVSISAEGVEPRQVGSGVSDPAGHFEVDVVIPDDMPAGPATISADCGIDGAALAYQVEVTAASSSTSLLPWLVLGVAVVALVGLVGVLARRAGSKSTNRKTDETAPAVEPDPAPQAATEEAEDDGAEYWFWETRTAAGPMRRLACLTDKAFHLHEVRVDDFQPLLDRLVADGPDEALSSAFVRIPIDRIDGVRYAGSVIHVDHLTDNGPATRTVDLGSEITGVLDLLSRRVRIVADTPTGGDRVSPSAG